MFKSFIVLLFIALPFVMEAQKKSNIIVDTSEYIVHTDIIDDISGKKEVGLSDLERMFIIKLVQTEVDRYNAMQKWSYNKDMKNAANPQYIPYECQPIAGGEQRYRVSEKTRKWIMISVKDVTELKDRTIEMGSYQRQYIVKHNNKGEKIVQVYFSCIDHGRRELKPDVLIITRDGGNCYFDVEINLTSKQLIGFYVNGIG